MTPYIITTGANGRCVIYGYSAEEPVPGQPYRLERAKMVIRWGNHGLLGLAANGPHVQGSRLTAAVPFTTGEVVRQVLGVSQEAAEKIDKAEPWEG